MDIFGSKNEKKTDNKSAGKGRVETVDLLKKTLKRFKTDEVLRSPRVTEKAALKNQDNVYVFEVDPKSTKRDIDFAIRSIYNVEPVKIRTMPIPTKEVKRRKGRKGRTSGGKKAYVYLKKKDSISLI